MPAPRAGTSLFGGLLRFRTLLVVVAPLLALLAAEQRSCCQGPVYFMLYFGAIAFGAKGLRSAATGAAGGEGRLQAARELAEDLLSSLCVLGALALAREWWRGGAEAAHAHAHP